MQPRYYFIKSVTLFTFALLIAPETEALGQEKRASDLSVIVNSLREAEKDPTEQTVLLNKIERLSWQVLLGEYSATRNELALPTTSINALLSGTGLMQEVEQEIEENVFTQKKREMDSESYLPPSKKPFHFNKK